MKYIGVTAVTGRNGLCSATLDASCACLDLGMDYQKIMSCFPDETSLCVQRYLWLLLASERREELERPPKRHRNL